MRVHVYGTRVAAEGWHNKCSSVMKARDFTRGDASACVFRQPKRRLVACVHGDDFTVAGPKHQLDWMKSQLEFKYELTVIGRLGPGEGDDKKVRILNCVIRWNAKGLEYEADPRQVEKLASDLGLQGAKMLGTPGFKQMFEMVDKHKPLESEKHTAFRASAAWGNYLSADRPEIQYAANENCRWMASPPKLGVHALKRLVRFLKVIAG